MPQEKKGKNPRVSKGAEKPQCRIHNKVNSWEIDEIHKKVCVNDELLIEFEGKHYCLFHLPTKEKDDRGIFGKKFESRLKEIKEKIAKIEKLPEDERKEAKNELSYDFRYVWFPSTVNLTGYKFHAYADFRSATFSCAAFIRSATFSAGTNFSSATFSENADFASAIFSGAANFSEVAFSKQADFGSATFLAAANFSEAAFSKQADFGSATFSASANFNSAKFEETSSISFNTTSFQEVAGFRQVVIKGYLYFVAGKGEFFDGEWFDDEKTNPKKKKRRTGVFEKILDFADVRAEKPERISFNKVRLRPCWLVNIDSRKFVFTGIEWENYRARKSELEEELKYLAKIGYEDPDNHHILTGSFRSLAANAEEFNRFGEASNFRRSALECERLERLFRRKELWREFKSEKGKNISKSLKLIKTAQFAPLNFFYRLLSFYGESWKRAITVLLGMILFFGVLYATPLSTFDYGETKQQVIAAKDEVEKQIYETTKNAERFRSISIPESLVHSLYVAAVQRPEPKPANALTSFFVLFETIFAPFQAMLLALAIRRKFMR